VRETSFQVGGGVSVVRLGGSIELRRAPLTIIIMQLQLKSCCCCGEAIRGGGVARGGMNEA
jgi:hypothetical protein